MQNPVQAGIDRDSYEPAYAQLVRILRGRIAAVNWVFIGTSNEIGAFESGMAAGILGTVPSVIFGGSLTLLVVGAVALRMPELRRLNLDEVEELPAEPDGATAVRPPAPAPR